MENELFAFNSKEVEIHTRTQFIEKSNFNK